MNKETSTSKIGKLIYLVVISIIILVPFYSFFSTWISSVLGGLLFWRSIKEVMLLFALTLAGLAIYRDKKLRGYLLGQKIIIVIGLFIAWQLFVTALFSRDIDATALGLAIQLRSVLFFTVALVAGYYVPVSLGKLYKLVLLPALGVVVFGLMQMFVLPLNFLSYFGYQKGLTIPAYFTIDDQLDKLRIASTLRGPNPLGVYLILPIMLLASFWKLISASFGKIKVSKWIQFVAYVLIATSLMVVMYGSHSRGAWLGLAVAVSVYVLFMLPRRFRVSLILAGALVLVVGGAAVYQYRNTNFIQNVVLHDDPTRGGDISSNQGHLESIKLGLSNVSKDPILGCGDGCAGPASVHNDSGAKISENYFIQTAEESGLVGLILLLVLFGCIARIFYQKSDDLFAVAMLASFIGICVASLTAHAWADDTTAYLWWGIAGLYFSRFSHSELSAGTDSTKK